MFTQLQYRILKGLFPVPSDACTGKAFEGKSKIELLLGPEILEEIKGKVVLDFGCGEGQESIELARHGARKVIGLDIRGEILETARKNAVAAGVAEQCEFTTHLDEPVEVIISIDSFEHFADPSGVLKAMNSLLAPGGEVIASFGPTWYHPLGGHLFSVFPWAHLIFSEKALIRWRSDFKADGATRFGEVAGGLNQMTITRFETLVANSPFCFRQLEAVPIRKLRKLHNSWTREFTTAVVRCRLARKGPSA